MSNSYDVGVLKNFHLPRYRNVGWVRALGMVLLKGNFLPKRAKHWKASSYIPTLSSWWHSFPYKAIVRWSSQIRSHGFRGAIGWAYSSWVFDRLGRRVGKYKP